MRNRVLLPALLALIAVPLSCATTAVEGQNVGECTDGADNDEDGLFDCVDPDCVPAPACAGDDDDDDTSPPGDDDTNPPGDDDTGHGDDDSGGPGDDDSGGSGDDDSAAPPGDDDTANPGEDQNPGDCGDGLDNDSDGLIDCKDPDCGGDPGVPPAPECGGGDDDDDSSVGDDDSSVGDDDSSVGDDDSSVGPAVEDCDNAIDDDNDGQVDCDDADCTGEPNCGSTFTGVEQGSMGPCAIAASTTSECVLPIGDPLCANTNNCASSTTHIDPYDVVEIAFTLNVTHAALGELTVSVVDHGGSQEVTLFSAGDLTGADFVDTVFLNCANTTNCPYISVGTAPYTGDHAPEFNLGQFNGLDINGDWKLRVVNTGATSGTVDTWSIGAVLQ